MPIISAPIIDVLVTVETPALRKGVCVFLNPKPWANGFAFGFGPNSNTSETVVEVLPPTKVLSVLAAVIDAEADIPVPDIDAGVLLDAPIIDITCDVIAPSIAGSVYISFGTGAFTPGFTSGFGPTVDPIPDIVVDIPQALISRGVEAPVLDVETELLLPLVHIGTLVELPVLDVGIEFSADYVAAGVYVDVLATDVDVEVLAPRIFSLQVIKTTTRNVPVEHLEDAKKLEADAYVELFEIELPDRQGKIYLKSDNDAVWQGNKYEGTALKFDGLSKSSSDETSRPKFSVWNPEGVFSYLVDRGSLDNATIYRIRLLKRHLEEDVPISRTQQWRVSRIVSITRRNIVMELRDQLDGQFFQIPGRMFIPPDFPQVSLS